MDAEMRAAIDWLNSHEGVLWSRDHHFQSTYALKLYSLKDAQEVESEYWQSWGRVDVLGRFRRPGKRLSRRPYFNYHTIALGDALELSFWYGPGNHTTHELRRETNEANQPTERDAAQGNAGQEVREGPEPPGPAADDPELHQRVHVGQGVE